MLNAKSAILTAALAVGLGGLGPNAHAETTIQQCGQQYQAAKAGGTLNGMSWNQFRTDCVAKLKAQPAATTMAAPTTAPAPAPAVQTANPLNPAPAAIVPIPASTSAASSAKAPSSGRTAFVARERECGSEWRANKVTLIAQTPTLTWPKYLSQCNARLKAAGK